MPLLLALALSASLGGMDLRPAALEPLRVTVTIGDPRVISVQSGDGWSEPGPGVVAPVPVAPARLHMTIPAGSATTRRPRVLDTV